MKYLSHIIATKGFTHAVGRAFQIFHRFLFGARRFDRMLKALDGDSRLGGTKITFFVTASLLQRNRKPIRRLHEMGHVIAAHGLYHSNMKLKSREEQASILRESRNVFESHGYEVDGFRCPYLSYNEDTIDVMRSSRYWWTSQDLVFWADEIPMRGNDSGALKKLSHIYKWTDGVSSLALPRSTKGIVEIPIIAPDDEMLVERYNIGDPGEIGEIWKSIFHKVHERGELFHLLYHPERFEHVESGLKEIAALAREAAPQVWIASLYEIADWWRKRSKRVWSVEKKVDGKWLLRLDAPAGSTLLCGPISGRSPESKPFFRCYDPVEPVAREDGLDLFFAGEAKRFTVGVSAACAPALTDFLSNEGFFVEETENGAEHSHYIGGGRTFDEKDKISLLRELEQSPEPLLRLWRWPGRAKSAVTISSDVDAITLSDFVRRALKF